MGDRESIVKIFLLLFCDHNWIFSAKVFFNLSSIYYNVKKKAYHKHVSNVFINFLHYNLRLVIHEFNKYLLNSYYIPDT